MFSFKENNKEINFKMQLEIFLLDIYLGKMSGLDEEFIGFLDNGCFRENYISSKIYDEIYFLENNKKNEDFEDYNCLNDFLKYKKEVFLRSNKEDDSFFYEQQILNSEDFYDF